MALKCLMQSALLSASAGKWRECDAASLRLNVRSSGCREDCSTERYSLGVLATPGVTLDGVYLFIAVQIPDSILTIALQENDGTWADIPGTVTQIDGSSLVKGSLFFYVPFPTPYTASTRQLRMRLHSSKGGCIFWWRSNTASDYSFVLVTEVATTPEPGDTLLLDQDVSLTVDEDLTLGPTEGLSLVLGTRSGFLVPQPSKEITIDLGAGRVHTPSAFTWRIGSAENRIQANAKVYIHSSTTADCVFQLSHYYWDFGTYNEVVRGDFEFWGECSDALRLLVAEDVAAGQSVVNTVEPLPAEWVDGDEITFAGKVRNAADGVTYYIRRTGERQIQLYADSALSVERPLDALLGAGGAIVNLTEASRGLGIQIHSPGQTNLLQSSSASHPTAARSVVVEGVNLTNMLLTTPEIDGPDTPPPSVRSVVCRIDKATSGSILFSYTPAPYKTGGIVENVHILNDMYNYGAFVFHGLQATYRAITIRGFASAGNFGFVTGVANTVTDMVCSGVYRGSNRNAAVIGSGHVISDLTIISGRLQINCNASTFLRVRQRCSEESGTWLRNAVGNRFINCLFGVGTTNAEYDIEFEPHTLSQNVFENCVVGDKGIAPNYRDACAGSFLQFHNYGGVVGDHRTWKREAVFTTDAPQYTNLVQRQQSAAETGEHQFALLTQSVGGQPLHLIVNGQMDAPYYSGASCDLPRVDVYTDGHSPSGPADASSALAASDALQTVALPFTPELDDRQIVLAFRTRTDQAGAAVRWSDARIVRRQWGYRFEEFVVPIAETVTYPVAQIPTRQPNPFVTLSEAEAGALTGISYDGSTITQTENHTVSEIYQWFQWWASQEENITAPVPFNTEDGINYTCNAHYILNGCTLSGSGAQKVIQLGDHIYSRENGGRTDGVIFVDRFGTHVAITLTNIVPGSTVQIYDLTDDVELYKDVLLSGRLDIYFTHTGDDHSVRIRVRKAQYLAWETVGILTVNGLVIPVNQTLNPVYDQTGVDGSSVTEFSFDGSQIKVFVDDPDGRTTVQRLIAWYYWAISSPSFIGLQGSNLTTPSAQWAQLLSGLQVKNLSTQPLLITGGNLTDADNSPYEVVDMTGGPVYIVSAWPAANATDMAVATRIELDTRSVKLDVPVSSRSSHVPADVWDHPNRSLSEPVTLTEDYERARMAAIPGDAMSLTSAAVSAVKEDLLTREEYIPPDNAGIATILSSLPARVQRGVAFQLPVFLRSLVGKGIPGLQVAGYIVGENNERVPLATPIEEIGSGWYRVFFTAQEMDAAKIGCELQAAGMPTTTLTIVTQ